MANMNFIAPSVYCVDEYVISSCSYTFHGYSILVSEQGMSASRISFESDNVSPVDVENMIINQTSKIIVFFESDAFRLLETLKKLSSVLNSLPFIRTVLIYAELPSVWLYYTLRRLVNSNDKLSLVRIASFSNIEKCARNNLNTSHDDSRSLLDELTRRSCKTTLKYFTKRELDVVLNSFRGITVRKQSELMGVSNKTIYKHRKEGLHKMHLMSSWLNEKHISMTKVTSMNYKDQKNHQSGSGDV
ncbi:hypothetical protein UXO11_22310 [Enterobacter wuhouensis]|uniref:hypothetical protein n=1 Tax=Enterobacter wuhouensis TaxID=2529381 RepID=UPI002FD34ADE